MIQEDISALDRLQVELKSTYKLRHDEAQTSYTIEFYIFIPNSLGINSHSYPKYLFYRDIQTYIRFKTPTVLLRDFAEGERSPLQLLKNSLQALAREPNDANIKQYKNQNKMFCSIFRSAMRAHVNLIFGPHHPTDIHRLIEQYRKEVHHIVAAFRKLRDVINVPTVDEKLFSVFEYSDEYVSLTVEQLSYDILEGLKAQDGKVAQGSTPKLLDLIDSETRYRRQRRYPSVVTQDSDNEEYVYRSSVLKDFHESILLLNTRMRQEGKLVEQVIFSLAAGLAMVFATAVAFYTQAKYGQFTMAFFVALVVSYMFKDRLKELVRIYLNNRVQRFFYDHKTTICGGSGRKHIGYSRERFGFVPESRIDPEICKLRKPDQFGELDNRGAGEQVILYRKNIQILSKNVGQVYQSHAVQAINDITRINLARFVRRMESPKKSLYVIKDDTFRKVRGSKVYHINLVARYRSQDATSYARFRLVLDRRGVKRIEAVNTP